MNQRNSLPCITDSPKEAWANGWWSGIAVGIVLGVAAAVVIYTAMRGA
ncbi:MAG TPA: hypothetical protein VLJ58_21670 [Ramlibacter sp.]|nr:hypothetical protein [Ramlibacter sp.]